MRIDGPTSDARDECEQVLRSLPAWFGIESALLDYAESTQRFPTFVACEDSAIAGFISVRRHFENAWEIHCIAVHASARGRGIGAQLLSHAERWMRERDARVFQVKTLAETHPSAEYAETRGFYARMGYFPLQVFPDLWSPSNPCLQMIKIAATD